MWEALWGLWNRVDCIDLDDIRLLENVHDIKNLTFHKMDATSLEFQDEYFDTVVIYNGIGHLSSIIEPVTKEAMRVLRKTK